MWGQRRRRNRVIWEREPRLRGVGASDRAEAALQSYLQHTPGPAEPSLAAAHWRLGMIHEKRGHTAQAREEYETALKLDPRLRGAKESLAKLK